MSVIIVTRLFPLVTLRFHPQGTYNYHFLGHDPFCSFFCYLRNFFRLPPAVICGDLAWVLTASDWIYLIAPFLFFLFRCSLDDNRGNIYIFHTTTTSTTTTTTITTAIYSSSLLSVNPPVTDLFSSFYSL
jgi:hypothetical protein